MQDSAKEAATSREATAWAGRLFLVFLVIFLILDCAESGTKSLRITYMLQFPLCGSDVEW